MTKPPRITLFELSTSDPVQLNRLVIKSKLLAKISVHVRDRGWTQADTAERLFMSQPRVSNLLSGKLNKFSIDFLLDCVVRLGLEVSIDVRSP